MSNAWFVSPLNDRWTDPANALGVTAPAGCHPGTAPSPAQVFAALEALPEYQVRVRRRDRKDKGQAIYIELREQDRTYAIDIHLLGVTEDDRPARVFAFDYYRGTDELVRLVGRLAAVCGPLVLWHDSGGEKSILAMPDFTGSAPGL